MWWLSSGLKAAFNRQLCTHSQTLMLNADKTACAGVCRAV
jgi:hypothetical protein